jgi:chromosome segregation ATPase
MSKTPSTLGLHLRYRIWIAEMNADITLLRVFTDYIEVLTHEKKSLHAKTVIEEFKKQFISLRQQIDDLRHEMHLQKMKLAASTRENKAIDKKLYLTDNHAALKKHYTAYQKTFRKMKTDIGLIKENWVD